MIALTLITLSIALTVFLRAPMSSSPEHHLRQHFR